MEHRRGTRKAVSLQIRLESQRLPPLEGEIVDISAGGAFIRVLGRMPAPNSIVQLVLAPAIAGDELAQCRALVIRCTADGIGVMFDRRQDIRALDDYAAPHSIPAAAASRMGSLAGKSAAAGRVPATANQ